MNIQNKRELQNVATYHSADIDYKDLQKNVQDNHIPF